MKKLIILLLLFPYTSFAAIAFDAAAHGLTTSGTSLTFAHTVTGSNTILIVCAQTNNNSDDVTGVTYNGVSMTKDKTQGDPNGRPMDIFHLINPATGANNVVISTSGTDRINGLSASYTGAKQSAQPDANGSNSGTATSITSTLTTIADNTWSVACGWNNTGASAAGTNVTRRTGEDADESLLGDSNGAITPAGNFSQTMTTGSSSGWTMVQESFAPFVAASASFIKVPDFLMFWLY